MQEIMQFISYHPIISIIWISLLVAVINISIINLTSKIKIVTCGEAIYLINKENAITIDLRKISDFRKGHIAGSINVEISDIQNNNIYALTKYKHQPIIIVHHTDLQVRESANILKKSGFKQILILKDGIYGWDKKNLPLVRSK